MTFPTLWMSKSRLREVQQLTQGHTASKQSGSLTPVSLPPSHRLWTTTPHCLSGATVAAGVAPGAWADLCFAVHGVFLCVALSTMFLCDLNENIKACFL